MYLLASAALCPDAAETCKTKLIPPKYRKRLKLDKDQPVKFGFGSLFLRNHSMNLRGFSKTLTSDSHCHNIVATLC